MIDNNPLLIYIDGACKGNPGIGGWGVVYKSNNKIQKFFGGIKNTTNNRMELFAAIKALSFLSKKSVIKIYTDSIYVKKGINIWINKWIENNWKNSSNKDVKNKDLWLILNNLCKNHYITWFWIKGHSGIKMNDLADELANLGVIWIK